MKCVSCSVLQEPCLVKSMGAERREMRQLMASAAVGQGSWFLLLLLLEVCRLKKGCDFSVVCSVTFLSDARGYFKMGIKMLVGGVWDNG